MKTLIITEKPKVSQKIAYAISDKCKRKSAGGVSYFEISNNGETIYVASAAGHLYSLKEKKNSYSYPVFDIEWAPLYEVDRSKSYTRKYISMLKNLASGAERFIIATDYDIEGELLGYNALRFACSATRAKRMRFSALTKPDLKRAYDNLAEVDLPLVKAGEARHIMDWYWGINTSRALSSAVKAFSKKFTTFSAGRVQTPALAILVEREKEIAGFVPEPFWVLSAKLRVGRSNVRATHAQGKLFDQGEAERLYSKLRDAKEARVERVELKESAVPPPVPFDLGTLQSEAYRYFRLSPKATQDIAQSLYESGYISYPRTSSQKLPPTIGYRRIIEALAKNEKFTSLTEILLDREKLYPRQGKKDDPAHPAIYPTGVKPKKLSQREEKLYLLIVHRFLATFGDAMKRAKMNITTSIRGEEFIFSRARTLEPGWRVFYPYAKLEEHLLPRLERGDVLKVLSISLEEEETKPPERYNPASLVAELERRGLGTKATRAEVVDTLYKREYITGVPIRVTPIGMSVIEALAEYVPEIIREELTRRFEQRLEEIRQGKLDAERTLEEAKRELMRIMNEFKRREREIGEKLAQAIAEKRKSEVIGKCPRCGGELRIIRSRKTGKRFIGCENYPSCNVSFPLPQKRGVYPTDKLCNVCGLPMVSIPLGRRRVLSCIDMNCKSKDKYRKKKEAG
ncbi:DNA topoisomerase I [Candidatus Pyrohabitans sp.]